MLERDPDGLVRATRPDDPWTPDLKNATARETREYINAELRYLGPSGADAWWGLRNSWLGGETPNEAFAGGRYEAVWNAAVATRTME